MSSDLSALTEGERLAVAKLQDQGRVKTTTAAERLAMIALKALGGVEETSPDVWEFRRQPRIGGERIIKSS